MTYDKVFDTLGDSTRRRIVEILSHGPRSVAEIASRLPVSRPAVSQHLRLLLGSGLVSRMPLGQRNVYSLKPEGFEQVRRYVDFLWDDALASFRETAVRSHNRKEKDNE